MKQTMQKWLLAGSIVMATCTSAYAAPHCITTDRVPTSNYPGAEAIPTGNNLILPAGKAVPIEGQKLIVTGHLVDNRCMPISEAVVELWQVDPYGHWFLAEDEDLASPNPTFAGAGRTTTDKEGKFTFITAFPGAETSHDKKNKNAITAPHLNLRINADHFAPVTTALFFQNDRRNAGDPAYTKLTPRQRTGNTLAINPGANGDLNGEITIVLPGEAPFRTY